MKILSINNTSDVYGASRCMERVFGRFAQQGHEVHAVLPNPGPLVDLLEARGVHVHLHPGLSVIERIQFRSVFGCLRFLFLFPISALWLAALILRLKIDVVHTNTVVIPTPAIAALITGRRHIWHIRDLVGEFGWLWKPYQRYICLLSSAVIAISQTVLEQFHPDWRSKVHVIYDGLDEMEAASNPVREREFRQAFPADAPLIGVVGRIKWHRKGQEVFVHAAALLREKHPNVRYAIVGSAAPGNEDHVVRLRELITSYGLDDTVTLTGDTDDPASVFAAFDIAVVPPILPEPFGCVVSEAMIVGTPVVGSRCGGIAEQIVDEVSGILFTPGDATALAEALNRLLDDPALRERIAMEGVRRVRNTFTLESTYQAMAALFEKVASPHLDAAPRTQSL